MSIRHEVKPIFLMDRAPAIDPDMPPNTLGWLCRITAMEKQIDLSNLKRMFPRDKNPEFALAELEELGFIQPGWDK